MGQNYKFILQKKLLEIQNPYVAAIVTTHTSKQERVCSTVTARNLGQIGPREEERLRRTTSTPQGVTTKLMPEIIFSVSSYLPSTIMSPALKSNKATVP